MMVMTSDDIMYYINFVLVFREQENFVSLSFETISAVGPNGAVIHYKYCH